MGVKVLQPVGEVPVIITLLTGSWPYIGPRIEFEGETGLPEAIRECASNGERERRLDARDDHGGEGVLRGECHDGGVASHAPRVQDAAVEEGEAGREDRHQEGQEGRNVTGGHILIAPIHVRLRVVVHEERTAPAHVLPVDGDLSHGYGDHHRRADHEDVDCDAEDLQASGAGLLLQGRGVEVPDVSFFLAVSGLVAMADGLRDVLV